MQIGRRLLQGPHDSLLHQDDREKNAPVDGANSWVTGADGNVPTTGKHFISAKGETRLGYWNVRTLSEPSRVVQLAEVFNEKRLDLLGVTETHLPGSSKLGVFGKTLLLSGRKDDSHCQGVGLMLSLKAEKCSTEWEPINKRPFSNKQQPEKLYTGHKSL